MLTQSRNVHWGSSSGFLGGVVLLESLHPQLFRPRASKSHFDPTSELMFLRSFVLGKSSVLTNANKQSGFRPVQEMLLGQV